MIDRRGVLAGMAAGIASPARAASFDTIGAALDEAAAMPPAAALDRLARVDAVKASPGRLLDLVTARAGLAIDAALRDRPDDLALRLQRTLGAVTLDVAEARLTRALAGLRKRAEAGFARIGMTRGAIGTRYVQLFADPRFHYPDSAAGRAEAVDDMNRLLATLRGETLRRFNAPPFAFDANARALSSAEIAAGKGGYRTVPTPDRPGAYIVDLRDIARRPRWSLPSVVAHELLPGHMLQLGVEAADPPHPLRLTYAAAFVEGWGIYAERLAADWGAFATPRAELGHLHWLIFRAARGLVDLNIHCHGWSTDRALAALREWQGVPAYFAPFDSDVARIVKDPGLRAAEAMAWLSIADRAPRGGSALRRYSNAVIAFGRKRTEDLP